MTIEEVISQYGIWAVIVYLIFKDALPTLSNLAVKLGEILVPAWSKSKQSLVEVQVEQEKIRSSLREREVVALEQIGKSMVVIDTRLQNLEQKIDLLGHSLITANQALAVVLDRVNRTREDYPDAGTK